MARREWFVLGLVAFVLLLGTGLLVNLLWVRDLPHMMGAWGLMGWMMLLVVIIPLGGLLLLMAGVAWLLTAARTPPSPVSVCPQCSRPVRPEWQVCPYCAARLPKEGEGP